MITSGFFGSSSNTGIIWYTPANLGEITSDFINISLSTNLPCEFELLVFGSVGDSAPTVALDAIMMGNPKDNKEYTYSILATCGIRSSVKTFKFIAKRTEPEFVTEHIIQLPSTTYLDYQILVKEPRDSDVYSIIEGELPPSLELTEDGRIVGANPFDNAISSVTIQIDEGYYQTSKQFTLRASPNVLEYDVPIDNTVGTFGYDQGSFSIDDTWLMSKGWGGLYSNITVNIGSRYFPKGSNDIEGNGYNDPPALIINVQRQCNLTVCISGTIYGSWGHKGENYSDDELFQYKHSKSLNGINGGVAVQVWSPCTLINSGTIYGGSGGGGAGGCGVTYFGRNDPGTGGMGGAAIDIRSSNVIIYNHGAIAGGGGGGAGGWGSEQDGNEPGQPGTDGTVTGHGGHGGAGTGTNASIGGIGGNVGHNGGNGSSVNYSPAIGGQAGYAVQTEYTYILINEGTILGKLENF
jgi:hypothetical protein